VNEAKLLGISPDTIVEARDVLARVRDRGVAWLLDHVDEDGRPAGADHRNGYHRVPWTLAVVGERAAAGSVLSWVERTALTPEGDLRPGVPREAWTERCATYPLSLLAQGAWALERYDTALAIMHTQRSFQHPETGGAFSQRPEARPAERQYLFPTAQLGLSGLTTGQWDIAHAAWGWMQRLWAAQPDLPHRLHTAWDTDGLVVDPTPEDRFMCVTDFREPRQAFYNPGIGAAFLSRYGMLTGDASALRMAGDLLDLTAGGTDDQFNYRESMQVCKFGWGSAMALEAGVDGPQVARLLRMTKWYVDSQSERGTWVPSGFLVPEPTVSNEIEKTAEHVLWVTMMDQALAGMDRPGATVVE
jgi:hypothetical protein